MGRTFKNEVKALYQNKDGVIFMNEPGGIKSEHPIGNAVGDQSASKVCYDFGENGRGQRLIGFDCPACGYAHSFEVPRWSFNGDFVKPTFSPSLRLLGLNGNTLCHLFVNEGRIEFCSDCPHSLAGKTIEMKPIELD